MNIAVIENKKNHKTETNGIIPEFEYGMIWQDTVNGHRVACLDASKKSDVDKLMQGEKAALAIHDPPYNVSINDEFGSVPVDEYLRWSGMWVDNTLDVLADNSSLYIWLGADIRNNLQPLPDFIMMMREKPIKIRNFITMRNQRGYGTQKKLDGSKTRTVILRKRQSYL